MSVEPGGHTACFHFFQVFVAHMHVRDTAEGGAIRVSVRPSVRSRYQMKIIDRSIMRFYCHVDVPYSIPCIGYCQKPARPGPIGAGIERCSISDSQSVCMSVDPYGCHVNRVATREVSLLSEL